MVILIVNSSIDCLSRGFERLLNRFLMSSRYLVYSFFRVFGVFGIRVNEFIKALEARLI